MDRMAKEGEYMSSATIDRLEKGQADSQILVLLRYAEILGLSLLDLFSFSKDFLNSSKDPRIIPYEEGARPFPGYVPVYPLKVAAGAFSNEEETSDIQAIGWVDANVRSGSQDYFASFVKGESMQPLIPNGALCLFRRYTGGTRQGRIFLIQARGLRDNETGDAFVVKKYQRQTPPRTTQTEDPAVIHLISENSKFSPIVLVGLQDREVQTLAEFIRVL
jgi:phage repressor protein C with HTH and peptisase S24 domain